MSLSRRADPIRQIATRLGQDGLKQLTREPTVSEAFRVSIQYDDPTIPNSIATVRRGNNAACQLEVAYEKTQRPAVFTYDLLLADYQQFLAALRRARFDQLDDEEDLPLFGANLWLVERAAGSFYHDIVLSPSSARGHHREVVLAIRAHLPKGIRPGVF